MEIGRGNEREWRRGDFYIIPRGCDESDARQFQEGEQREEELGREQIRRSVGFGVMIGSVLSSYVPNQEFSNPNAFKQLLETNGFVFVSREIAEEHFPELAWLLLRMAIIATKGLM